MNWLTCPDYPVTLFFTMACVKISDLSKSWGDRLLFSKINIEILEGRRYGFIGANGTGKTTLINMMLGKTHADSGVISIEPGLRIAVVAQIPEFPADSTVFQALAWQYRELEQALRKAEDDMSQLDAEGLEKAMAAYQRARDAWDEAGGDEVQNRIEKLLEQTGMSDKRDSAVDVLSGGEKNVVGLIRTLLTDPQLLILDEPGNHLDYEGLAWLESFLVNFRGTVLIVSHNRYLLDRVATDIIELENGQVVQTKGNYSDHKLARLRNASAQQAAYAANQKTIARIEEMVRRFAVIAASRPDPAWGKRLRAARSRLNQEHERAVERPDIDSSQIRPDFADGKTQGDAALIIKNYSMERGGKQLLDGAELEIERGMRVALIGPNGCGKTSLLEDLMQHASWDHDHLRIVDSLKVGYVRQRSQYAGNAQTLEDEIRSWGPLSIDQAFAIIKPMNFRYEDMEKPLSALSGGESNRLQIARLMYERPDLLILDEPTNHLDIRSREALEEALESFAGTLLVVSHDRYFLDRIADHVAEFSERRLMLYAGSFSEFFHHRGRSRLGSGRLQERKTTASSDSRRRAGDSAGSLESRIEKMEADIRLLEDQTSQAIRRGDHQRARTLSGRLDKQKKLLDELYEKWDAQ